MPEKVKIHILAALNGKIVNLRAWKHMFSTKNHSNRSNDCNFMANSSIFASSMAAILKNGGHLKNLRG